MPSCDQGIHGWSVYETPIAVLDFETTGTVPGRDRVIEVAVLRIEPGSEPEVVFDTLINPRRRVRATEIHGISDEDVADAPEFSEIAGDLLHSISDCVLAAYNVYFDLRFLEAELELAGLNCTCPHFCLMYLRPMLGLGSRCSLEDACRAHGIDHVDMHFAAADAEAGGRLFECYVKEMRNRHLRTFGELARLKSYKFLNSFAYEPLGADVLRGVRRANRFKSRYASESAAISAVAPASPRHALGEYWEALSVVLSDLEITDEELEYIEKKKRACDLADEQIHMLHARAFASVTSQLIDDDWLDAREVRKLRLLHACLRRLGWAPGD